MRRLPKDRAPPAPNPRSSADVAPSAPAPSASAGSRVRSSGGRKAAYRPREAPATSTGMARPSRGRSTVTPPGETDRVIHTVPLATATDRTTWGSRRPGSATPGGSPPGVQASSVSTGAGRMAGVVGAADGDAGAGPGMEGRGAP